MKKINNLWCYIAVLLVITIFAGYLIYVGQKLNEINNEIQNNDKFLIEDKWIQDFKQDLIEVCLTEETEEYCNCCYEKVEQEFGRDGMIVLGMYYAAEQEFSPETEMRIATAMLQCDYLLDL